MVSADPTVLSDAIQGITKNLVKLTAESDLTNVAESDVTASTAGGGGSGRLAANDGGKHSSRIDSGTLDMEGTPLELSPKSPPPVDEQLPVPPPRTKQLSSKAAATGAHHPSTLKIMSDEFHDYSEIYTPNEDDEASKMPTNIKGKNCQPIAAES